MVSLGVGASGAHSPPVTYLIPLRARRAVRSISRRTESRTSPTASSGIGGLFRGRRPLGVRRPLGRGPAEFVDLGGELADLVGQRGDLAAQLPDVAFGGAVEHVQHRG